MSTAPGTRLLVACPACDLQFDASGRATGSRFRCPCGEVVTVTEPRAHEASVVRCSACGGPRQAGAALCRFCGCDFTLHEQDLHTICPACATRISDRSRFCHACGVGISPQAVAGEPSRFGCPACGGERRLNSRSLPGEAVPVLECDRCAGLWLGSTVFEQLEQRARADQTDSRTPLRPAPSSRETPVYRPCPICGGLMHRRNHGRKSGVIVDTCAEHGIWFDDGELAALLEWTRAGGQRIAAEERQREDEEAKRHKRLFAPPTEPDPPRNATAGGGLAELVRHLVDTLAGWR